MDRSVGGRFEDTHANRAWVNRVNVEFQPVTVPLNVSFEQKVARALEKFGVP
jgi:hypothetical protein